MNTQSGVTPDSPLHSQGVVRVSESSPFYWSVCRELWEFRSIYIAPLAGAAVMLLGFTFVLFHLPYTMRTLSSLDPARQRQVLAHPYDLTAGMIMAAAFLVSIFYSLDALYSERRERSILFWKSLPVSDLTTVLAKATIPLLVLPLLAFAVTLVTQTIMLLLSTMVLFANGLSVTPLWTQLGLYDTLAGLLYHLVTAHMLWYAPFYAWMLLVSAWARRAPFLWAFFPPLAIGVFEKIAFHSSHFAELLTNRLSGTDDKMSSMMGDMPFHPGMHFRFFAFLFSPGLWLGLAVAAAFLAAAVRVRRNQGPI